MIKTLAVWALTMCCANVAQAQVKSCPPGQILRVSSGVCQAKSAENLHLLKSADGKRKAAKQPAGKPVEATAAFRAEERQPQPSFTIPSEAGPSIVSPAAKPIEITAPWAKGTLSSAGEAAARPNHDAANSPASDGAPMSDVVGSIPRKLNEPAADDSLVGASLASPLGAAASAQGAFDQGQAVALAAYLFTPRSAPPLARETQIEQSDASAGLPEWGDRQLFADALRADWKGGLVKQTFLRGTQMGSDVPLQPVPEPYASRNSTGVRLHYVVANNDIVLVLPLLRVVVDVYSAQSSSPAAR